MIIGAHSIVYSTDPDADRAFLREVLQFPHVDVGGGWLIFGLPPAEVAVHPAESGGHELYLMVDDVAAFVREMAARDVACAPVTDQRWGLLTEVALPSGGKLGVYQPRHARPPQAGGARPRRAPGKKAKQARKAPGPKASSRRAPTKRRGSASKKPRRRPA
ncbi:MAG TPA: VOC family protein [Polyangia bacterium]|nr:VOC family protein [Polyangia bacterium]